ncbi:Alcohol dehydrogenase, iron-type [Metarhizium album ARSEF 1941]|uniref:Alcohol dehydrogenase, iron-type n=1 Tax=Metarhizium album (strain ARSEF 1941) TaxID=1081103 RepID=A0A0B2WFY1_METAS|nr:Alcohol dehydrogenase, iron-type [Metarhizium album ARSEF 1941]KHN94881.1 Alcohol dehydrogenase, iron-type [Metarhizium album ARSEF 1941]
MAVPGKTAKPAVVECTSSPFFGLWKPQAHLKHLFYGPSCVSKYLETVLPSDASRVFIVTGATLAKKTPLVHEVETLLGAHHAGTFAGVRQHGPVADVEEALGLVLDDASIDTVLSLGGGSPIDAAKTISHRVHEQRGHFLTHIAIPTTLSAAECTAGGGYTGPDGTKVGFMAPGMGVAAIFYDPLFSRYTPRRLLLATGIRAVDHAVETAYHPTSSEMPWKALACWALQVLFEELPRLANSSSAQPSGHGQGQDGVHGYHDSLTRLFLAAYATSGLRGANFTGNMGLSHALGQALGSPYGISHGETSCLTLAPVIRLKAELDVEDARCISRLLLPATGKTGSGNVLQDAMQFADDVAELVQRLDLRPLPLSRRGVGHDQVPVIVQRAMRGSDNEKLRLALTALVENLL